MNLGEQIAAQLGPLTLAKCKDVGFANARANDEHIRRGRSVAELRGNHDLRNQGESAIVVATGPSLRRRDYGDILVRRFEAIIATESSLAWCLRQRIIPDLVVTLDPHASRIVRWFGDPYLTADKLRADDYFARQSGADVGEELSANERLCDLLDTYGSRIRIAVSTSSPPAVVKRVLESGMQAYWWNPMYDDDEQPGSLTRELYAMNGLPCINALGNVGAACWVFAHAVLGKRRVGTVGIDFSYPADTPYERTQYYRELVDLVGVDRLDEVYVRIRNPHDGAEYITEPAFLWYRDAFLQMAQHAKCQTFNCSGGGILFGDRIHQCSLEEFLTGEAK